MNLYGAKPDEIVGLANFVSRDLHQRGAWGFQKNGSAYGESNVAGIRLKLTVNIPPNLRRGRFSHMTGFNILGNGWMVAFQAKPTTRTLDDIEWHKASFLMPKWDSNDKVLYYIYSPSVISPDQFQRDMTLLRLFSSEWE